MAGAGAATHDDEVILALRALGTELAASNRAAAAALGINDSDLAVLDLLHREGPMSPSELARRTGMGPTTMTSLLKRLERGGWVERRSDADDRRSVTIHVSGTGRLAERYAHVDARILALTQDWTPDDRERLVGFLTDVAALARAATLRPLDWAG